MNPGTNFPQMWVSEAPSQFKSGQYGNYKVITAFVHNQNANVLSALGQEEAVRKMVALLDRIFRRPRSNAGQEGLASEHFVKGGMMDWSQEPYIEAG
jgi:monoamine oxidase